VGDTRTGDPHEAEAAAGATARIAAPARARGRIRMEDDVTAFSGDEAFGG
jgi:hypothetical protein